MAFTNQERGLIPYGSFNRTEIRILLGLTFSNTLPSLYHVSYNDLMSNVVIDAQDYNRHF